MRTPTVSMPEELIERIDEARGQVGALNRSEFIRMAIREKFEKMDVDVEDLEEVR